MAELKASKRNVQVLYTKRTNNNAWELKSRFHRGNRNGRSKDARPNAHVTVGTELGKRGLARIPPINVRTPTNMGSVSQAWAKLVFCMK